MSGVVDTNLLLYAANRDDPDHAAAARFLSDAAASSDAWYLTEGIAYEFLRVATHPRVFGRPLRWDEGMAFLTPLFEAPSFQLLSADDAHWHTLAEVLTGLTHPAGNLFFDIRTATLMRARGVRTIYTADTDFLQFGGIRVVNPLR